jgi:phage tail-like protein
MRTSENRSDFAGTRHPAKRAGKATAVPAPKRLLDYLPAIYHEHPEEESGQLDKPTYLAVFLLAFERLLFGHANGGRQSGAEDGGETIEAGLEEEIVALPSLLDPLQTPEEFLPWLASWAALGFHPDMSVDRRRWLVAQIIPLYRIRGTSTYLEKVLTLCVDAFVSVSDTEIGGFELGTHSTVGMDTYIGGGPPHFFSVRLVAPRLSQHDKEIQLAIARSVIELAKPAHTFYELLLISPQMELGKHSTVGLDTVLGPPSAQA